MNVLQTRGGQTMFDFFQPTFYMLSSSVQCVFCLYIAVVVGVERFS